MYVPLTRADPPQDGEMSTWTDGLRLGCQATYLHCHPLLVAKPLGSFGKSTKTITKTCYTYVSIYIQVCVCVQLKMIMFFFQTFQSRTCGSSLRMIIHWRLLGHLQCNRWKWQMKMGPRCVSAGFRMATSCC